MRPLRLALMTVLAVTACLVALPTAQADSYGTISGSVSVPDGYDVRDVRVSVVKDGDDPHLPVVASWVPSNGSFSFNLVPGDYRVSFGTNYGDMDPCRGNPTWWTSIGVAQGKCAYPTGPVDGNATVIHLGAGDTKALGQVALLTDLPTYHVSGTILAPSGETTAGVQVELWMHGDGAWPTGTGSWHRLTSVPTQTLTAAGTYAFDLLDGYWEHHYALRFVDPGGSYDFSFVTSGVDDPALTAGAVGVQGIRTWAYADQLLPTQRLKHDVGYVSGGVTITGTPEWGRTLTAHSTVVWAEPAVGTTFQWYRNGAMLDGATGATYTTDGDQDGWGASFTVRAQPSGFRSYNGTPIESSPVTVDNTSPVNRVAPKVTGAARVGTLLTSAPGTWGPTYPTYTYTYQWLRDGAPIPGATATTYRAARADAGHRVQVRVGADHPPWFPDGPGFADSVPRVVRYTPAVTLRVAKQEGHFRLVARVTAGGKHATGKVVLTDGKRRLGRVSLSNGRGVLVVNLKGGRHRLTARFVQSSTVAGGTATVVLRVR